MTIEMDLSMQLSYVKMAVKYKHWLENDNSKQLIGYYEYNSNGRMTISSIAWKLSSVVDADGLPARWPSLTSVRPWSNCWHHFTMAGRLIAFGPYTTTISQWMSVQFGRFANKNRTTPRIFGVSFQLTGHFTRTLSCTPYQYRSSVDCLDCRSRTAFPGSLEHVLPSHNVPLLLHSGLSVGDICNLHFLITYVSVEYTLDP